MHNDNDKSYRKSHMVERIERRIESDKKEATTDIALLGASALAVGIGALGIVLLGDDVINAFKSGNALTLGSFMSVRFQEAGVGISISAVLGGIIGTVKKLKDTISSFKKLNHDKDWLKEVEEIDEKGRTR